MAGKPRQKHDVWTGPYFYTLQATKYNQLLNDNITKTYKKADNQLSKIDAEAKAITKKLGIDDRVEVTA